MMGDAVDQWEASHCVKTSSKDVSLGCMMGNGSKKNK